MNEESQISDLQEPAPAITLRPDPIVSRRVSGIRHLQRLVLGSGAALLMSIALAWYASHSGQDTTLHRKANGPPSQFKLPPLELPLPKPASAGEREATIAPDSIDPSAPTPVGLTDQDGTVPSREHRFGSNGSNGANGANGASVVGVSSAIPRPDDGPVLWRNHPDVAAAAPRDSEGGGPEHRLMQSGYDPARAMQLPPATYILAKGTSVGCTLETAIDSQLPGLVTCLIGMTIYGADGRVALLPRGTRLLGEARSEARTGQSRVYVLWVEARTPEGMLVPLASPGTDALGRAGVPGQVDTHFFDRFGAAMLISVMDAGVQLAATRGTAGSVIVAPQSSEAILTEVLRNTVAIPPTIKVNPGAHVSVLVARDVDFGSGGAHAPKVN